MASTKPSSKTSNTPSIEISITSDNNPILTCVYCKKQGPKSEMKIVNARRRAELVALCPDACWAHYQNKKSTVVRTRAASGKLLLSHLSHLFCTHLIPWTAEQAPMRPAAPPLPPPQLHQNVYGPPQANAAYGPAQPNIYGPPQQNTYGHPQQNPYVLPPKAVIQQQVAAGWRGGTFILLTFPGLRYRQSQRVLDQSAGHLGIEYVPVQAMPGPAVHVAGGSSGHVPFKALPRTYHDMMDALSVGGYRQEHNYWTTFQNASRELAMKNTEVVTVFIKGVKSGGWTGEDLVRLITILLVSYSD